MISCIVPVYNNEKTIGRVLKVLASCDDIGEIFVIDDGSTDDSVKVIKSTLKSLTPKVKIIINKQNLGKGATVIKGIKQTREEIILLCDADLSKIQKHHIVNIINEHKKGYDMVIAGRESKKGIIGNWMANISGERILYKKNIEPYLNLISEKGNGIEQIINFVHKKQGKKIKIIVSKNIGHILKCQRKNKIEAMIAYLEEGIQIVDTSLILQKLKSRKRLAFIKKNI